MTHPTTTLITCSPAYLTPIDAHGSASSLPSVPGACIPKSAAAQGEPGGNGLDQLSHIGGEAEESGALVMSGGVPPDLVAGASSVADWDDPEASSAGQSCLLVATCMVVVVRRPSPDTVLHPLMTRCCI